MLHDEIVARVRDLLVSGEIAPGARVPERALCHRFGISRTPLREALKVLAAEGHVQLLHHRGARATKLTAKDVQDLFEICEGLEALAGELCCARITDEQVGRIAQLHREMVGHYESRELPAYFQCNRLIHEIIVQATGNAALIAMYESVAARIRRARYVAPMPLDHWALAVREHEAILNALDRRDGVGLGHLLRRHLRAKREQVERAGFADVTANAASPRTNRRRAPETPASEGRLQAESAAVVGDHRSSE
jgi:DNA-binding GntR family transcriptional regulator